MDKIAFELGVADGMDKVAIVASGIGAATADKGHRWEGAGRGFLYGIPLGFGGAVLGSRFGPKGALVGSLSGRSAAGIIGGRHASGKDWLGKKIKKK